MSWGKWLWGIMRYRKRKEGLWWRHSSWWIWQFQPLPILEHLQAKLTEIYPNESEFGISRLLNQNRIKKSVSLPAPQYKWSQILFTHKKYKFYLLPVRNNSWWISLNAPMRLITTTVTADSFLSLNNISAHAREISVTETFSNKYSLWKQTHLFADSTVRNH